MSYLVLARKYRPQTFADVIGQEQVTKTLTHAIEMGRLHHAFLFCGGRGTGKTTTARILAKVLSCHQPKGAIPCNHCEACIEITEGTSVDVQEIDAASQNKVEDIRELRESIRYAPLRGKKKVFILDEVHMLSTSAFNALLKTLEEPPPHAVFIFATTDPHKIPSTILSRVQRYDFRLLSISLLVEHLSKILTQEEIPFEPEALLLVAQEGAGSVRDSLSLLDQVLASHPEKLTQEVVSSVLGIADRRLVFQLGQAIIDRNPENILSLIQLAHQRSYDLVQLSKSLLSYLRDLLVVRLVEKPASLLDAAPDELELLKKQANQAGASIEFYFQKTVRLVEDVARSSLPKMMLEVGLLELCEWETLVPLSQMIEKLEQLETTLQGKPSSSADRSAPLDGGAAGRTIAERTSTERATLDRSALRATPPFASSKPAITSPASKRPLYDEERATSFTNPIETTPSAQRGSSLQATAFKEEVAKTAVSQEKAPIETSSSGSFGQDEVPAWELLAQRLIDKVPLLHSIALSHPLVWDGKALVLGVTNTFVAEQLKSKTALLQQHLQEWSHRKVSVEIRVVDEHTLPEKKESLLELNEKKIEERKQQQSQEALTHPSRSVISEVFGEGITFHKPKLE